MEVEGGNLRIYMGKKLGKYIMVLRSKNLRNCNLL